MLIFCNLNFEPNESGLFASRMSVHYTQANALQISALPPKADIAELEEHVRFVPKADIGLKSKFSAHWLYIRHLERLH